LFKGILIVFTVVRFVIITYFFVSYISYLITIMTIVDYIYYHQLLL